MTGELILNHELNGVVVAQRPTDRYVDATALCKAGGKPWHDFWRLDSTQELVAAVEVNTGQDRNILVQTTRGRNGGTFVHPHLAVALATWLSPEFHAAVCEWVYGALAGDSPAAVATLAAEVARLRDEVVGYRARPLNILAEGPAWTIDLRLIELHPDWRTSRRQRARVRYLAKKYVQLQAARREVGTFNRDLAFVGDQINFLDKAIAVVHREAVADGKKDDWGLLRDVVATPSSN